MSATVHRTRTALFVFIDGALIYKRWHESGRPDRKTGSAFFCPWTGRIPLPPPADEGKRAEASPD